MRTSISFTTWSSVCGPPPSETGALAREGPSGLVLSSFRWDAGQPEASPCRSAPSGLRGAQQCSRFIEYHPIDPLHCVARVAAERSGSTLRTASFHSLEDRPFARDVYPAEAVSRLERRDAQHDARASHQSVDDRSIEAIDLGAQFLE